MIQSRVAFAVLALAVLFINLLNQSAVAHPVPEVPVKGTFTSKTEFSIQVEIDPRCFAKDAEHAPYLKRHTLQGMTQRERDSLLDKAKKLVTETLHFRIEPSSLKPKFAYRFEERPKAIPDSEGGVPVIIVAEWRDRESEGLDSYQLDALKTGRFSVHFINTVDGEKQRLNVLFPGESSYRLTLSPESEQRR